jgi:hypothetical protein
MAPWSPARVVGLTAQALVGLALALTNPAARAAEQPGNEAQQETRTSETVTASITGTKLTTPVFDGEPKLEPIAGTSLKYVVNSATPIILVGTQTQRYYAVENGVWFKAANPRGPWVVAASVPAVLYMIPPSSHLHYVTYVKIYDVVGDTVYISYTPGYRQH